MQVTSISLFPKLFPILSERNFNFLVTIILLSAKALNMDQSSMLSFGRVKAFCVSDLKTWDCDGKDLAIITKTTVSYSSFS